MLLPSTVLKKLLSLLSISAVLVDVAQIQWFLLRLVSWGLRSTVLLDFLFLLEEDLHLSSFEGVVCLNLLILLFLFLRAARLDAAIPLNHGVWLL